MATIIITDVDSYDENKWKNAAAHFGYTINDGKSDRASMEDGSTFHANEAAGVHICVAGGRTCGSRTRPPLLSAVSPCGIRGSARSPTTDVVVTATTLSICA